MNLILFYLLAAVILISGLLVVTLRNVFHSALFLVLAFFMVAGIYLTLSAEFLAAVQVLIYVGGILVLLLFGVMLTNKVVNVDIHTSTLNTITALVIAAVVAGTLSGLFYSTWSEKGAPVSTAQTTTKALGEMLMTSYLLPFEVASVVLVVALIGAAWTSRRSK